MADQRWEVVDRYLANHLAPQEDSLAAAVEASARAGLPRHEVSPLQGKLLHLLTKAVGARKVLEIGTLGGYSTIWLARGLVPSSRKRTAWALAPHPLGEPVRRGSTLLGARGSDNRGEPHEHPGGNDKGGVGKVTHYRVS
jgi:hypothetical protein